MQGGIDEGSLREMAAAVDMADAAEPRRGRRP